MARGNIRPGGRTERVRQAVAATVLQFIKEGKTDFAMTDVAERSGIARSTIHARWPSRDELMAEALRAHNSTFQVARMDDWRLHLNHIARAFRDFGARPDEITFNALAANIRGGFLTDETQRQWQAIAEDMAAPLHEAQAEGRIRQDIDPNMVITMLFTSITGLIVIAKNVPTDDYLHRLVSLLIAGCEVRP